MSGKRINNVMSVSHDRLYERHGFYDQYTICLVLGIDNNLYTEISEVEDNRLSYFKGYRYLACSPPMDTYSLNAHINRLNRLIEKKNYKFRDFLEYLMSLWGRDNQ